MEQNVEGFSNKNTLNQEKEDIKFKQIEQLFEKKMLQMNDKFEKEIELTKKQFSLDIVIYITVGLM